MHHYMMDVSVNRQFSPVMVEFKENRAILSQLVDMYKSSIGLNGILNRDQLILCYF